MDPTKAEMPTGAEVRRRHWWERRGAADAGADMDDKWTVRGAWAQGWNDAVDAYADEAAENFARENP